MYWQTPGHWVETREWIKHGKFLNIIFFYSGEDLNNLITSQVINFNN